MGLMMMMIYCGMAVLFEYFLVCADTVTDEV
jgi:hypothetical protein